MSRPDAFVYRAPSTDQVARMEILRAKLREASTVLATMCPEGRERSLAMTKLEECSMWANKAIVFETAPLLLEGQPH